MVARDAGTAGPVLLACRQWDRLGLARRLPSLGVGAWRCAPLLPWRVQCPVCVCAALAAGSGGSGRYLVLCLSRFPLPAPRVPRCVWRAVPSGCPLPSLAGTPSHAVCAFRALGPAALLVVPACPFRVCALALPRRPLPPPRGGVACASRVVPALGAGRAVPRGPCPSACPAPVPCSVWRAWGGGGPVPVPPYLAWGCGGGGRASPGGGAFYRCEGRLGSCAPPPPTARPLGGLSGSAIHVLWARACGCGGPALSPRPARPMGAARCGAGPWRSCAGGRAGGGGGRAPYPPVVRPGGGACRAGGRSASFRPSAFPGEATKRVSRALCCPSGGVAPHTTPVRAHQASLGTICAASWRVGAGSLVLRGPDGSRRLGRGGGSRSGSSLGRGGDHPPCLGGWGPGPPRLAGRWGSGGGGVAPRPPCSPSGRRPAVLNPGPLRVAGALPSGVRVRSGSKCRPGVGGGEGRPVDCSPGGLCRPEPPLCPP